MGSQEEISQLLISVVKGRDCYVRVGDACFDERKRLLVVLSFHKLVSLDGKTYGQLDQGFSDIV